MFPFGFCNYSILYIISQTLTFLFEIIFFFSQTLILVAPLPISLSPWTHTGTAAPLTQIFSHSSISLSFHCIPAGSSPLRTASLSEALEFFQSRSNFLNLQKRGKVCNYFRYRSSIFVLLLLWFLAFFSSAHLHCRFTLSHSYSSLSSHPMGFSAAKYMINGHQMKYAYRSCVRV